MRSLATSLTPWAGLVCISPLSPGESHWRLSNVAPLKVSQCLFRNVKVRLPWLGIVIPDWQCKIGAILNTKPNKWTNGQIVSTKLLFTPYFLDKYNEF